MNPTRSLSRALTVSLFAACALVWAGPAEARFGKASSPASASEKKAEKKGDKKAEKKSEQKVERRSESRPHTASAVPVRGVHAATPVYAAPRSEPCCGHRPVAVRSRTYVSSGAHVHSHHDDGGHESGPDLQRFELLAGAQPAFGAGILSAGMLADWTRWGLDARVDHLVFLPEEWGSPMDTVTLFDASVTRALVSGEKGRLRGHLGLSSAFAPDATFVGPYAGLSASATLLGPLTFDAAANLTLIPFTKIDTRAGLGLRLGVVEVRGWMRLLTLDDQGRVDGVRNTELFVGPYASAGLVF